ncbi:hypothetical protein ACEPAI_2459 [Sanghuangporus weigelae]
MPSSDAISGSQLDITWGCFFIGLPLWGIGCLQLYLYYEEYRKTDQRWFKLYILLIWILDTVHQFFVIDFEYVYFVKGIIDSDLRALLQKTLIHIVPFTGTINAMIQVILVRRAWWLSDKNHILTGILCMAVLAQFTITVTCYVKIFNLTEFTELYEVVHLEFSFTCVAVFTDTLLAVTLVWLLWKARSGFPSSNSVVNRLVSYIMGSTLVTALCMGIAVISALVAPNSFIYMTADTIIPKLYFNCLLASLNARSNLRERLVTDGDDIILHFTDSSTNLQGCLNTRSPKVTSLVSVGCQSDIDVEAGSREQQSLDACSFASGSDIETIISNGIAS